MEKTHTHWIKILSPPAFCVTLKKSPLPTSHLILKNGNHRINLCKVVVKNVRQQRIRKGALFDIWLSAGPWVRSFAIKKTLHLNSLVLGCFWHVVCCQNY